MVPSLVRRIRGESAPSKIPASIGQGILRFAGTIDLGAVEKFDAKFERAIQHGNRFATIACTIPAGNLPASEPLARNAEIAVAEFAKLHNSPIVIIDDIAGSVRGWQPTALIAETLHVL